jgi:hypothetical protein
MNKILFIITAFSPENAIGSVRLTKIVKFLVRKGCDITVISPELHSMTNMDNSLESKELIKIARITLPQSYFFTKIFLKQRNKIIKKQSASNLLKNVNNRGVIFHIKVELIRFIHFFYTMIRNKDWSRQVIKYSKLNFEISEFDVVISSYPSLASPWSSHSIKKLKIADKWICDFRDPINYKNNSNFILFRLNTLLQNNILKYADCVTHVSHGIATKFNSKYNEKFIYLPNGFDSDDLLNFNTRKDNIETSVLTISYVGSLYGGQRSVEPLFKAIKILQEGDLYTKIRFLYAGKEFPTLYAQAEKYGVEGILEDKGFVSRMDAISIQMGSDIVIVATWNTIEDQGILTGKLLECLLTRKTMLGLVSGTKPLSELYQVVNDINGGYVLEEASLNYVNDFKELQKFLIKKYNEKIEQGNVANQYNKKIKEFEYESIIEKLFILIKNEIN